VGSIRLGRDFFAGLLFIVFGALALGIGTRYPLGTTARMGPGYFPMLIGGLLALIGIIVAARGVRIKSELVTRLAFKPLLMVLGAVLLFAGTIERLGLALAVLAVVVVGYLANARWRWPELLTLALILTGAAVLIFHYGLKLPFKVWPGQA
jgi:Tripartite tricarboxylate transporter TctB family